MRQFPHTEKSRIWHVAFRPDGKAVAMAGIDHMVRLWDPATGDPIGSPMPHQDFVSDAAFSPDSKTLITVDYDQKAARMWDAATGKPIGLPLTYQGGITGVAYSPDGKTLITVDDDRRVARLWDTAAGKPIGRAPVTSFQPQWACSPCTTTARRQAVGHDCKSAPQVTPQEQGSASFSPDGTTVLTAGGDQTARLWVRRRGLYT